MLHGAGAVYAGIAGWEVDQYGHTGEKTEQVLSVRVHFSGRHPRNQELAT